MNLLADIITYVRRIVKPASNTQITDGLIIDYINRFYTYDVPARNQLFELKTIFTFPTIPLVDQYNLPYDSDYNLQYQMLLAPVLCDGVMLPLLLDRNSFEKVYPNYFFSQNKFTGNGSESYVFSTTNNPILRGHIDGIGTTALKSGTPVPDPSLQSNVFIIAPNSANQQMTVYDTGQTLITDFNTGILGGDGTGTVNYATGEINVNFNAPVPSGDQIIIKTIPFAPGTPRITLLFNNIVTLRPCPDIAYIMQFDAYLTPAAFLASGNSLPFGYMSEYIARGAARKILSDTGDLEQFNFYEPFFREQEALVIRRTNRQQSDMRTSTIFTDLNSQSPYQWQTGQGA